jgi:hypothetical protein
VPQVKIYSNVDLEELFLTPSWEVFDVHELISAKTKELIGLRNFSESVSERSSFLFFGDVILVPQPVHTSTHIVIHSIQQCLVLELVATWIPQAYLIILL